MFDFFTRSRFQGRPVELYMFSYGDSMALYTDAEYPVTVPGVPPLTYEPIPISRGTSVNQGTLDRSTLEITMPRDSAIPELFRVQPPRTVVTVTIYQGEAEDPDAQFLPLWNGRVLACSFVNVEGKLSCEPISTSMTRIGLRRNFQYMCPHMLYGPNCRADILAATNEVYVASVSGKVVTLAMPLADPSHYIGGMLRWPGPDGSPVQKAIHAASSTTLTLSAAPLGLGTTADAVKGCPHTLAGCRAVHSNANNFGGHPWIPLKNPISNISPY